MAAKEKKESKKVKELEEQLHRALADYSNLQKRVDGEKSQFVDLGREVVLAKFLSVYDTLEELEKAEDLTHLKQGLELAVKQFKKVLQEEGVEEISQTQDFDPAIHEAIGIDQGEEENTVSAVVQKGFKVGDRVLRPTRVKVFKKEI